MLKVLAGDLAKALSATKPRANAKKRRPIIVSLEYRVESGTLAIIEAKHAIFASSLEVEGDLVGTVQLDGRPLFKYVSTWPPETKIELDADRQHLILRAGSSSLKLPRTDSGGSSPIVRKALPINKRHKGKVEPPPDAPRLPEPLSDTWSFSARVPMPSHRIARKGS